MNDAIIQAGRTVFAYASTEHQRRHGPRGYTNYRAYKPWLRDEFAFRCVYCLSRERWCPNGHEDFAVDHLMPRSAAPGEARDYDNLVYACQSCNRNRQDAELPIDLGRVPLAAHLRVATDGTIQALTREGRWLERTCHLNRPLLVSFRKRMLGLIEFLTARGQSDDKAILYDLLGFPDSLPDLAARRAPAGNTRPEGIVHSHFARRQRGELPRAY
jgi:hypothetical protein